MPDFLSSTAVGAAVGSMLSAWWRKAVRWQVNVAAGFFVGWFGGDALIAYAGWEGSAEVQRAVGGGLALIAFSLMDGAMRVNWGSLLQRGVNAASSKFTKP